eukprot:TRINITY_DN14469_c0_g1_i1.p1 TRINITY_DN14469_c0_g1~~TRINITY_DN14469_c0_g1_i1.p1  ORF type:complete len:620 (+),score=70.24 TRINITY_DN14469_c0_g1_i1:102-1961(+)
MCIRDSLICWLIWRLLCPRRTPALSLPKPSRLPRTVLVIGAGSSGLVTTKTLLQQGFEVICVDAGPALGGTFENKRYRDSRMVSSKYLTLFSDFRRPDAEMHMTLSDYVEYLQEYSTHFGLGPHIKLNTTVLSVERTGKSYRVMSQHGSAAPECMVFEAVAVCSGLHNTPRVPSLFEPAQAGGPCAFKGQVIHSADYKIPDGFKGKRVLVIGAGETAFDVGYGAASAGAAAVTLSTRNGFVSIPAAFGKDFPPLDTLIMNVGTHAWESDWSRQTGFHWWFTTKLQRTAMFIATGSSYGYNQWVGRKRNMSWDEGRKHVVNKSSKCMPLLSRKVKRNAPFWQRWLYQGLDRGRRYDHISIDIDLIEQQAPASFHRDGVTVLFEPLPGAAQDACSVQADVVVLATGYKQHFPFLSSLLPQSDSAKHEDGLPPSGVGAHFIVDPQEPTLGYIGFVRPNVGAIPPMAELQAMWWALRLKGVLSGQPSGDEYRLVDSHLSYGVDYGYYMFALAREMGSIPSLKRWVFESPRALFAATFGQAHMPIFRLDGPYAQKEAVQVCATELVEPILMRPYLMQALTMVNFCFFATVNTVSAAVEWLLPMAVFRLLLPARRSGSCTPSSCS